MSGPVRRSIGSTKSRASGAMPRKLAFVSEPDGGLVFASNTVADMPPLLRMVPATCVPCPSKSRRVKKLVSVGVV